MSDFLAFELELRPTAWAAVMKAMRRIVSRANRRCPPLVRVECTSPMSS